MEISFESPEFKEYLKGIVAEVLAQFVAENELKAKEISLIERLVRVEEELKALREIQMTQFEAIEKRFEAMEKANQQRFEALEKRLSFLQWFIGIGFIFLAFLITLFNFLAK